MDNCLKTGNLSPLDMAAYKSSSFSAFLRELQVHDIHTNCKSSLTFEGEKLFLEIPSQC